MVKWYKKTVPKTIDGIERLETEALMVFKLDGKGNAVYTQDIGDLVIFLTSLSLFASLLAPFGTCVLTRQNLGCRRNHSCTFGCSKLELIS
ncbi:unnamed protein product [Microthlaspi erraticum]|uniref:Uncharacterized protein n=1 Tax=Microthlaspi erraticum TaxID=1685480 RepID=A0A6D2KEZ8_9BRAS|nr:unnamed protein product [Microthlaspi erraticum]